MSGRGGDASDNTDVTCREHQTHPGKKKKCTDERDLSIKASELQRPCEDQTECQGDTGKKRGPRFVCISYSRSAACSERLLQSTGTFLIRYVFTKWSQSKQLELSYSSYESKEAHKHRTQGNVDGSVSKDRGTELYFPLCYPQNLIFSFSPPPPRGFAQAAWLRAECDRWKAQSTESCELRAWINIRQARR